MRSGAVTAGHGDPRWLEAVQEQAATLTHTSNLFHTVPQVRRHSPGQAAGLSHCADGAAW